MSSNSSSGQSQRRGAFIVLEGADRSGKTTQTSRLFELLRKEERKVERMKFPERKTEIGWLLDKFLKNGEPYHNICPTSRARAVHLLFSANRWEFAEKIRWCIRHGVTVVCDRYSFSGIAYTAAQGVDIAWCRASEAGLPAPDVTIFLDVDPETTARRRGFGAERYESEPFQQKVYAAYKELGASLGPELWRRVDASQSEDCVAREIEAAARETTQRVGEQELQKLW